MNQRRVFIPHVAYHLIFNTKFRIPYFNEDIFACILGEVILHAEKLKDFVLIAYKINPDHVHLLVKCGETYDGTQIVHCIKRISAVQINQIITLGTEEERKDLAVTEVTVVLARAFKLKYGAPSTYPFPLFKWQPGFTDVTIHSRQQLMNTWRYIRDQATHHNLEENTHLLLRTLEPAGLVFPG